MWCRGVEGIPGQKWKTSDAKNMFIHEFCSSWQIGPSHYDWKSQGHRRLQTKPTGKPVSLMPHGAESCMLASKIPTLIRYTAYVMCVHWIQEASATEFARQKARFKYELPCLKHWATWVHSTDGLISRHLSCESTQDSQARLSSDGQGPSQPACNKQTDYCKIVVNIFPTLLSEQ